MPVPHRRLIQNGAELWTLLEKVRVTLGLESQAFAELLGLTPTHFKRLRTQRRAPSLLAIERLSERIDVGLERLMTGNVDLAAIARRFQGDQAAIPERYLAGAFSRKRTSIDLLNYIGTAFGWHHRLSVLRHFEMNEQAVADPDSLINLNFLTDLCEYLSDRGLQADHFVEMGKVIATSSANRVIRDRLSDCSNSRELYDLQINHLMSFYDTNYRYRTLRLKNDSCVIQTVENPDVLDALKLKHLGSQTLCAYRLGRVVAMPAFAGFPHARVVETHCVHRGDPDCRFHVQYEGASRVPSERFH